MAIAWSVLRFRPYPEGRRFKIRTDHNTFNWMLSLIDSPGHLVLWRLRRSEFDSDVGRRAGIKHQTADAVLRVNTTSKDERSVEDDLPLYTITVSTFRSSRYMPSHTEGIVREEYQTPNPPMAILSISYRSLLK